MRLAVGIVLSVMTLVIGSAERATAADCAPNFVSVLTFSGRQPQGEPKEEVCRPLKGGAYQISDDFELTGPRLCVSACPGKRDSEAPDTQGVYRTFADNFSRRYIARPMFQAGTYIFTVNADDGVRLYIDGAIAVDDWSIHPARVQTVERVLTAGRHEIVVEYFEATEAAIVQVGWRLR